MGWFEDTQIKQEAERRYKAIEKARNKKGLPEAIRIMNLGGKELEDAQERQRIDDQWQSTRPTSWGRKQFTGERRMLYDILTKGELVEAMVGGTFRQDTHRLHGHKGVAVATDKRVIFADHGIFGSAETMQINYAQVESISNSKGMFAAGVQVAGIGASSFRIEDIQDKQSVFPFVHCVQTHLDDKPEKPGDVSPTETASTIDELERLANLVDRGFLDRSEFDIRKRELLN